MNDHISIGAYNISKSFKIPHEQSDTFKERLVHLGRKMTYETFNALDGVSFEVKKGEFFGIIGGNGSGKSTLLKILAGIYLPDSGIVKRNGEISPFLELGVGFNPELSGKDNIYLNGIILGLSKKEIDKKYKTIVEFSELERFIHLKLKNFSSGMHVRLAFSTAIHANRDIFLLDEVLAVGDAAFKVKCFEVFHQFISDGKTIIFVSHDLEAIRNYSNRVLYLKSGKPLFLGNPEDAINKYLDNK